MTLQVATLYQISQGETTLVGVFSTPAKAIGAGQDAIRDFTSKEPLLLDWDHEHPEHRYYYDGFTLAVTEVTLDQAI